jgi:hypothetical protein
MAHILRQGVYIGIIRQHTRMQVVQDVIAKGFVHMLKIFTPRQLEHEFVLHPDAVCFVHMLRYLRHIQQPMGQVRRQQRDSTVQMVAGLGVFEGADGCQTRLRSVRIRLEQLLIHKQFHGADAVDKACG